MRLSRLFFLLYLVYSSTSFGQTETKELDFWKFSKGENTAAFNIDFDDSSWETVKIPHDWAIYGPFDKQVDKQTVIIEQNNEEKATEKTGRTGALPFVGVGWYRTSLNLDKYTKDKQVLITFEGAMSNAEVDKYSYVAKISEVIENDYNLNIPRYVDTFEEEEPVDLNALIDA